MEREKAPRLPPADVQVVSAQVPRAIVRRMDAICRETENTRSRFIRAAIEKHVWDEVRAYRVLIGADPAPDPGSDPNVVDKGGE